MPPRFAPASALTVRCAPAAAKEWAETLPVVVSCRSAPIEPSQFLGGRLPSTSVKSGACEVRTGVSRYTTGMVNLNENQDNQSLLCALLQLAIEVKGQQRMFKYDRVFDGGASQAAVYEDTKPLVRSVLDGAPLHALRCLAS